MRVGAVRVFVPGLTLMVSVVTCEELFTCCVVLQVAIRTAGGIPAIVACIGAHPGSVDVAHYACRAMASLTVNAENMVRLPC